MQSAQPTFGRRGAGSGASFERTYASTSSDILDRAMGRGQSYADDVAKPERAPKPSRSSDGGFDIKHLLFSFDGRTRRLHYWMVAIPTGMVTQVVNVLVLVNSAKHLGGPPQAGLVLAIPVLFLLAWIGFAVQFKRLHDRGKSAWWLLLIFVPLLGPLWLLVELGFLPGDPGPNRFGPSPKDPHTDVAEVFA